MAIDILSCRHIIRTATDIRFRVVRVLINSNPVDGHFKRKTRYHVIPLKITKVSGYSQVEQNVHGLPRKLAITDLGFLISNKCILVNFPSFRAIRKPRYVAIWTAPVFQSIFCECSIIFGICGISRILNRFLASRAHATKRLLRDFTVVGIKYTVLRKEMNSVTFIVLGNIILPVVWCHLTRL